MTTEERVIAGFPAVLSALDVGAETIALWQVADLERHVDRRALLAGDDPPEPPYWAHRWSGAAVLGEAVRRGARSAILRWKSVAHPLREEGLPVTVHLVEIVWR